MIAAMPGARRWLLLVWVCFLARGVFSSVLLPLWEGYDEWAHFAYVERLAYTGSLPVPRQTRVSREVYESLRLAPLAWATSGLSISYLTQDQYWRLPADERDARRRQLAALPQGWAREEAAADVFLYEAQQPPLYYLILAPVQLAAGGASLPARVLLMRLVSLLLASLAIPIGFAAARVVLGSEGLAVAAMALVAAVPGFLMSAARIGNDGLSTAIFAALLWAVLSADRLRGWRRMTPGLLLGAGLLTKAYFLTALPALGVIYIWRFRRRQTVLDAALTYATGGAIAGWWYWRNRSLTGAWSGLQQVSVLRDTGFADLLRQAAHVDWPRWFDTTFFTHIWFGNWSFLQVRGWIYHFFGWVALAAAVGLLIVILRNKGFVRFNAVVPSLFVGFFLLGLAYHELTFSFQGVSSGAGWYLSAVVVPEALLAGLGLMAISPARCRKWVLPSLTACFVALDVYATNFLLIPYYTGFIAHRPNGTLESFHLSQLSSGGLAPIMVTLWAGFMIATLALPWIAARAARHPRERRREIATRRPG
jgi:hypothetical protein